MYIIQTFRKIVIFFVLPKEWSRRRSCPGLYAGQAAVIFYSCKYGGPLCTVLSSPPGVQDGAPGGAVREAEAVGCHLPGGQAGQRGQGRPVTA